MKDFLKALALAAPGPAATPVVKDEGSSPLLQARQLLDTLAHFFVLKLFFIDFEWDVGMQPFSAPFTTQQVMERHGIQAKYERFVQMLLRRLVQHGHLQMEKQGARRSWYMASKTPTPDWIRCQIKALQTQIYVLCEPVYSVDMQFLCAVASNLYPGLTGRNSVQSLLFPPEDDTHKHRHGAIHYFEHSVLRSHARLPALHYVMSSLLRQMESISPVRILEIGGGHGAITAKLLQALVSGNNNNNGTAFTYTFTDICPFAVGKARQKLTDVLPATALDFIEFATLDITADPTATAVRGPSTLAPVYDIVLAVDVFHATPYLQDTLAHTRRLCAPGGVLVLGEIFGTSEFLECAFGLTDCWWRFEDDRRVTADGDVQQETEQPLLSAAAWVDLQQGAGFGRAVVACDDGQYGVICAQASAET